MSRITLARKQPLTQSLYPNFDVLDGSHPWQELLPKACVLYRARVLPQGKVVYFNYVLGKEMGLVSPDHPHQMNSDLERQLVQTFSLQIINEYDELTRRRIDPSTIKPKKYMATRYLQLQHSNKKGKTSGDGRGIWNGLLSFQGKTWDVSSRGTGVTCLAPGSVQANRPLKTGTTDFGYGCGQAEIDELYGAAILAETLHLQGISTERVLCIIDLGRGVGIGVRAAPNLLRPAHLFLLLKQSRMKELKAATQYFVERQFSNQVWNRPKKENLYDFILEKLTYDFARFVAQLESDYIFAWLDWDGDNVLASAGIIDYGSVRQFGVRHDAYRYDDVDRFSTTLTEQKTKARQMIQVFCQMIETLKKGKKRSLAAYKKHQILRKFDQIFLNYRSDRLLYRIGFNSQQRKRLLENYPKAVQNFDSSFSALERMKIRGSPQKVSDGVNHPALFNMRKALKLLPELFLQQSNPLSHTEINETELLKKITSRFASKSDSPKDPKIGKQARALLSAYREMIAIISQQASDLSPAKVRDMLQVLDQRSQIINKDTRMTGNALIQLVDLLVTEQKKGLPQEQIQNLIDKLVLASLNIPEVEVSKFYRKLPEIPKLGFELTHQIQTLLVSHSEDI